MMRKGLRKRTRRRWEATLNGVSLNQKGNRVDYSFHGSEIESKFCLGCGSD